MPIIFAGGLPDSFLWSLATAAARALVLAGAAGFGLAMFRAKATLVRLSHWTAVLYSRSQCLCSNGCFRTWAILHAGFSAASMRPTAVMQD